MPRSQNPALVAALFVFAITGVAPVAADSVASDQVAADPSVPSSRKAPVRSSGTTSKRAAAKPAATSTGRDRPVLLAQAGTSGTLIAQATATDAGVPLVPAPVAAPPAPRFDITRYDVQGNTVLDARVIESTVAPYTGAGKDFGDVQKALESLQIAYQRAGYGTVQVTLPEQELDKGVVVLRVLESKLGKVVVEGNRFFTTDNVRRSLPALREGTTPNSIEVGRQARVANENPSKNAAVILRAGTADNEVDAVVRINDDKFWRGNVSLDNTGSPATGMYRLGFGYQFTNLFDRDHVLTLQYLMSPERLGSWEDVKVFGVGYRIPLYARGDSLEFVAGYSDVANATVANLFSVNGSGTIFGVRYNHMLPRVAWLDDYEHRVTVGLDYKSFSNNVTVIGGGANLVPEVTVHPLSVTYTGTKRFANAEMGVYASVAHNIYPHGPDAGGDKFYGPIGTGLRPEVGRPTYTVWRYGVTYARAYANDTQMRVAFSGQWTRDALIPGEKFGLGGADSIRGMLEREAQNDRGHRGSVEFYSPDLGSKMAWMGAEGAKLRLLAFVDWGQLQENRTELVGCAGNGCGQSALSTGVGMRVAFREGVTFRLDYGHLIDGGGASNRSKDRYHFGMAVTF